MAASTSLVADKANCGEAVANFNRIIGVIFTLENHPTNTFMLLGTKTALTDGFVHKLCDIVFDTTREVGDLWLWFFEQWEGELQDRVLHPGLHKRRLLCSPCPAADQWVHW